MSPDQGARHPHPAARRPASEGCRTRSGRTRSSRIRYLQKKRMPMPLTSSHVPVPEGPERRSDTDVSADTGRSVMVLNLMPHLWRKPPARELAERPSAPPPGEPVDVASAEELARHGRLVVTSAELGTAILLVWTRRGVFAVENRCPHRGARLDDAAVGGRTITCPMHGRRYDLRSGRCT